MLKDLLEQDSMKTTVIKRLIIYTLFFIFSTVGYYIRQNSGIALSPELNKNMFWISITLFILGVEIVLAIHKWLNKVLSIEQHLYKRFIIQALITMVIIMSIRAFLFYYFKNQLPPEVNKMFIAASFVVDFFLSLALTFMFFTRHFITVWKASLVRADKLEKEKLQVSFDNLKNQLNPHFLFNALTSLNTLIYENQDLASKFLEHLSLVYRYLLQHKNKDTVTLDTELNFIKNYVFLLETRFESTLKITFSIDDAAREMRIVPVTMQVLLENAIKHNKLSVQQPLHILVEANGEHLQVSNNLQVKRNLESSNKQGLENLRSLYGFLIEKPVVITETSTHFKISIPLLSNNE